MEAPGVPFWAHYGAESAEQYCRWCEQAADVLYELLGHGKNPGHPRSNHVLYDVLDVARVYLESQELKRARKALMAEGGTPRLVASERGMLGFWRECVQEHGLDWGEAPPWVARFEEWERTEAKEETAASEQA